jgi:aspartate kinase
MITTSEIKISVVVDEAHLERGVRAVHQAFELDKPHQSAEHSLFE